MKVLSNLELVISIIVGLFAIIGGLISAYKILKRKTPEVESKGIKDTYRILFIDDKIFKVITILRNHGWSNVDHVRDVESFEDSLVQSANAFFVDIHGVGKKLNYKDEGLGLAKDLKERFPDKKVVIYSNEPTGNMFHEALKIADDTLPKTSDPTQFLQLVETLSGYK